MPTIAFDEYPAAQQMKLAVRDHAMHVVSTHRNMNGLAPQFPSLHRLALQSQAEVVIGRKECNWAERRMGRHVV